MDNIVIGIISIMMGAIAFLIRKDWSDYLRRNRDQTSTGFTSRFFRRHAIEVGEKGIKRDEWLVPASFILIGLIAIFFGK
jgi:hypothetical protein